MGIARSDVHYVSTEYFGISSPGSTAIYAAAYNRNPEFYSFYRSLQAYKNSLGREGDVMVVSPDSDFFRYFKSPAPTRR